nr:TPA_inf: conotoxin precursor O2 [Conus judaeus]
MQKLTILLLVAAVLMSIQALNQRGGVKRPREMIKYLSKRKTVAESWWEGECSGWSVYCTMHTECCSGECIRHYCTLW